MEKEENKMDERLIFPKIELTFQSNNKEFRNTVRKKFNETFKQSAQAINGVYLIYNTEGECLYVGKGAPIIERLFDHNNSAYNESGRNPKEPLKYFNFWKTYQNHKLSVYIIELKTTKENTKPTCMGNSIRQAVEEIVKINHKPLFWN